MYRVCIVAWVAALAMGSLGCGGSSRGLVAALNDEGIRVFPSSTGWYDLRADDGLRVQFPGVPSTSRVSLGGSEGLLVELGARRPVPDAESSWCRYSLLVVDVEPRGRESSATLRAIGRRWVTGDAVIASDRPIEQGGVAGREMVVAGARGGGVAMVRTFVARGRLVQLAVVHPSWLSSHADRAVFFDSVELPGGA